MRSAQLTTNDPTTCHDNTVKCVEGDEGSASRVWVYGALVYVWLDAIWLDAI